ncbi:MULTISPECIES: YcaO-like family protein [unclassified Nonomuraea]|uniref:YcaO-like family protein n=1 Tax=unclassified Nonomuraea TaxID=2593643 RepID=UPI00191C2CEB|nr:MULTISPECIES: YcaO-like family protein [unclassified Nonomuraea]
MSRLVAVAEAVERYAGMDHPRGERIWATAAELGDECLEPERYPRCTAEEYAHPRCPVRPFDPHARIRWERGIDLITLEPVWVPAVMACYGTQDQTEDENFAYRISTGYAVHTDPLEAVVRGMFEVIERDIIAIVWHQRLPLPLIEAAPSDPLTALLDWSRQRFMHPYLFDATSDLGVPTVYCVLSAEHDLRANRLIGAGTGRDLTQAAEKALSEALLMRTQFHGTGYRLPASPEDFRTLEDTARYMGVRERAHAFDFLTEGAAERPVVPRQSLPDASSDLLRLLVTTMSGSGMRPVAVERTTVELADAGFHAVNVIIPDLQPMSGDHFAQFKAHPRLYEAPALMGYRVLAEQELNAWPQPFA